MLDELKSMLLTRLSIGEGPTGCEGLDREVPSVTSQPAPRDHLQRRVPLRQLRC